MLKEDKDLSYQMGTLFHGALMELLPKEISDELHTPRVHPYAQYIDRRQGRWYWVVTALTAELSREIIYNTLVTGRGIELKKPDVKISFEEKKLKEITYETMTERMYTKTAGRYIQLQFITPTAFKQQGNYLFYPDIRSMYISLLNKYGAAQPSQNVRDEDLLGELTSNTRIIRYDLRSVSFHIEGGKVPAFIGSVTLKIGGNNTLRSFADFLFHFGEYSGIGIKSGLGMGAVRIIDGE